SRLKIQPVRESDQCSVSVTWNGNLGSRASVYRDYSRNYEIDADGNAVIHGSADPAFRGGRPRWNPEELLVTALSACHKLWHCCRFPHDTTWTAVVKGFRTPASVHTLTPVNWQASENP